jgi:type II secretory pathway predicted ATPase ExeA
MEINRLKALYGLKYDPFSQELPVEGLQFYPKFNQFCTRVEDLVLSGGYAACIGDPGLGKSAILRMLDARLSQLPNVVVGEMTRPHASVSDFYRELSDLFSVPLSISNRYGGHKALQKKWSDHIKGTLFRPILLIDEAQCLNIKVIEELKAMSSDKFDTQQLLTIVLAGDHRLSEMLEDPKLKPINSRIRKKLILQPWEAQELETFLIDILKAAGAPALMTEELIRALVDKSMGNLRTLMNLSSECLAEATRREQPRLDEKLFFECIGPISKNLPRRQNLRQTKSISMIEPRVRT